MALSKLSTSLMPDLKPAELKKWTGEIEKAEAALKKNKADAEAKKSLKAAQESIAKVDGALGKVVDALAGKLAEINEALNELGKKKPLPDTIDTGLAKQRRIAGSSRSPEIDDLRKEHKRGTLRSNPSKLERLVGDLNGDVDAVNKLAADFDEATDLMYAEQIAQLEKDIEADLPKPISGKSIMLDILVKNFTATNQKKRWKNFDAAAQAFKLSSLAAGDEVLRKMQIRALATDKAFADLPPKRRSNIVEDAIKGTDTVAEARQSLQDALDAQVAEAQAKEDNRRTLKQAAWAKALNMEGYVLDPRGKFEGDKMHVTYDNNSWTKAAYAGVSLDLGDADKIFDALFKVEWKYQLHMTLELPTKAGDNAHVYAYGKVQKERWEDVRADNDKDAAWVKRAQAAMKDDLANYIADVKKKIKAVQDKIV